MAHEAYRAVFLRVHPTGKMVLSLTTEADGEEAATRSWSAGELGVPPLDVKVVPADEDRFGAGHGYNTSPSAQTPAAIHSAAGQFLAKAPLLAGAALETSPDSLSWDNGAFVSSADPSQARTIADVALYAHGTGALPPGVEGGLDAQTVLQGGLAQAWRRSRPFDLVGDLERPEQRGVRLHAEIRLLHGRAAGYASVVCEREVELHRRLLAAEQVELALHLQSRAARVLEWTSLERNSIAQPFSTSLSIVFLMSALSSLVERLHAAAALDHPQRARVGGERHRGLLGRLAQLERRLPRPDFDLRGRGRPSRRRRSCLVVLIA